MPTPSLSRRQFLAHSAALSALPSLAWSQDPTPSERQQYAPNIILIMADDMGWFDLGINGNHKIKTPNLDAMARAGVNFTRCYAPTPQCAPTRAAFVTGRHSSRQGVWAAGSGWLRDKETTLPRALKPAGYTSGHFGKWHIGRSPKEHGYDEEFWIVNSYRVNKMNTPFRRDGKAAGKKGYCETVLMDEMITFIEQQHAAQQPFLSVLWNLAPHTPHQASDAAKALYPDHSPEEQEYFGMISDIDREVGKLRKRLRELGIADNTLLMFSSDNGGAGIANRGSPLSGGKGRITEGGLRVPGIAEWPARMTLTGSCDIPINLTDLFPTALAAAGIAQTETFGPLDGLNLLPLFTGQWQARPEPMGFHFLNQGWGGKLKQRPERFLSTVGGAGFAVIDNQYKLLTDLRGQNAQLYNLVKDPGEKQNLADSNKAELDRLQAWRQQWWNSVVTDQKKHGFTLDEKTGQPDPSEDRKKPRKPKKN